MRKLITLVIALIVCMQITGQAFAISPEELYKMSENIDIYIEEANFDKSADKVVIVDYNKLKNTTESIDNSYLIVRPGAEFTILNRNKNSLLRVYYTVHKPYINMEKIKSISDKYANKTYVNIIKTNVNELNAVYLRNDGNWNIPNTETWVHGTYNNTDNGMLVLPNEVKFKLPDHITNQEFLSLYIEVEDIESKETTWLRNIIKVDGTPTTGTSFIDVTLDDYYAEAVNWAVKTSVTSGVGNNKFDPKSNVTRAQAVTFLWRLMGRPVKDIPNSSFTDIPINAYYEKAVNWSAYAGITDGVGDDKFAPNDPVTYSQILTFLWRATNKSENQENEQWYSAAENWAIENNILGVTGEGYKRFANCTRGDVVYYIYNAVSNNIEKVLSNNK